MVEKCILAVKTPYILMEIWRFCKEYNKNNNCLDLVQIMVLLTVIL